MTTSVTLSGCAPVPLAHYLKALGILRLVSEQKDPAATGRWHRDQFILNSTLDREALLAFFLEEYQPTPIVVPWSGNDFFAVEWQKDHQTRIPQYQKCPTSNNIIEAILSSRGDRLSGYRTAIKTIYAAFLSSKILSKKQIEGSGREQQENKRNLLQILRNTLDETALRWLDCATVIGSDSWSPNNLLGSGGGSDGNSHFSDNFMQALWMVLQEFDEQRAKAIIAKGRITFDSKNALISSLLAEPLPGTFIAGFSPVLFNSRCVGGTNATTGFDSDSASNPWDFVLMLEGAVLFSGSAAKKLGSSGPSVARFPFLFEGSSVGGGSQAMNEQGRELWLPLWETATSQGELETIFANARIERKRQTAATAFDAYLAVTSFGSDVGIAKFRRTSQMKGRIGGENYFTNIDLGWVDSASNPTSELVNPLYRWYQKARVFAKDAKKCPIAFRQALAEFEVATINATQNVGSKYICILFLSIGKLERVMGRYRKKLSDADISPIPPLPRSWISKANIGTTEFRLAASLGSITGEFGNKILPMRCHLEQVTLSLANGGAKLFCQWADPETRNVQWIEASLTSLLNKIFSRRLFLDEVPLSKRFEIPASLPDIKQFIEEKTDDSLLTDLLWSMSLIDWSSTAHGELSELSEDRMSPVPPTLYALLKLCFPPVRITQPKDILAVPAVIAIHRYAAQGEGNQAATLAIRRLRGSGYSPVLKELSVKGDYAKRTAAALLFPISDYTLNELHKQTNRPEKEPETASA